jgi:L-lactate dehydrogenase (cytochrome)
VIAGPRLEAGAAPPREVHRLAESLGRHPVSDGRDGIISARMSRVPRAFTIDDLRRHARRRLPRAVYDFIEGGAGDERTVARNRTAFEKLLFEPRVLVDVSKREQSTVVLGERVATPVILSPTGMAGLSWPKGEVAAARGAHEAGTIYTLSTHSSCSIEEVAAGAPGPLWFQLYVWQNRDLTRSFVERARAAGYKALLLTVDVPVVSRRERDLRNGFTIPPRVTARNVVDTLRRARWVRRVLMGQPRLTLANLVGAPGAPRTDIVTLAGVANRQVDPSISWADLAWFRSLWSGPLLLKGVMTAADARRAVEHGVDGLVVSNHGGRQLDGTRATIEALPEIIDAVHGRLEVLLDGGVRRGADVVRALALGARAVMIGRPYLYGLAISGQAGVRRAIEILTNEIDHVLALSGVPRVADLEPSVVRRADPV